MLSPHLKLPPARLLEIGEPAEISVAQKFFHGEISVAQRGKYQLLRMREILVAQMEGGVRASDILSALSGKY